VSEEAKIRGRGSHVLALIPLYIRVFAIVLLAVTAAIVAVNLVSPPPPEFRMKGFPTGLSEDVVATINGYERRESDGVKVKYFITADQATTFADNHQELVNVFLEVFDDTGEQADRITASKAVYVPGDGKEFTAFFAGSVKVNTSDGLEVKTEQVTYKSVDGTVSADENVEFRRENISGRSIGAMVRTHEKRLELLSDVELLATSTGPNFGASDVVAIAASNALYDQDKRQIDLKGNFHANAKRRSNGADEISNFRSGRAVVVLASGSGPAGEVKTFELFDEVAIDTTFVDGRRTAVSSDYALYDRQADRFDLRDRVTIRTVDDARSAVIRAGQAVYEQANGKASLKGDASITQENDVINGREIVANLYPTNRLRAVKVTGESLFKRISPEQVFEVSANSQSASFRENGSLISATATGSAKATFTPTTPGEYSKMTLSSPGSIDLAFGPAGILDNLSTQGRTTLYFDAPGSKPDGTNRQVTADSIRTYFDSDGKNLRRAEAIGDAELLVDPVRPALGSYRTTVNAPRFECEFFAVGNSAKACTAATGTKAVRVPTVAVAGRGNQTLRSDRLLATFGERSRDLERLDAFGSAKFTELERNAIADQFSFTTADEVVRLRGGDTTVWDSQFRARADEIDWDTRSQRSFLRGKVSTTYFKLASTNGAMPFTDTGKPIYVTSQTAEFDSGKKNAMFSGNARGWQESNYVRADMLFVNQADGTMRAEGDVQSLLYRARRNDNKHEAFVPINVSASRMNYDRGNQVLRYEDKVDIRQGSERIFANSAIVYFARGNELSRTEVQGGVTITQPNRRATGDFALYSADDESFVLRGTPARIEDAQRGMSQGSQFTFSRRDNIFVAEGSSPELPTGRTRSVYKINNK
jgi:lipopolysaccharide export system protein LptA